MDPHLRDFAIGMMLLLVLGVILMGCDVSHKLHEPDPQSWAQDNLKRNDTGCPTAIFIAPHGNLQECPPE
jgi:hypothetical protein